MTDRMIRLDRVGDVRTSAWKCLAAAFVVSVVGCSKGPARVAVPDYDPGRIAAKAIELFDADGDGALTQDERSQARSLDSAMSRLDADRDGRLTVDEIAARINKYVEFRVGLAPVMCTIRKGGRPVVNAVVTYEPEEFMGSEVVPGEGTTDDTGRAVISVGEAHLPSPRHSGVRPGFYRVHVKLADGSVPESFNAGIECAGDVMNTHAFALP